jgi:hypothetical protein
LMHFFSVSRDTWVCPEATLAVCSDSKSHDPSNATNTQNLGR